MMLREELVVERGSCAGDWTSKQQLSLSQCWSSAVFQSIFRVINAEDLHFTDMTIEELNICVSCNSAIYLRNTFHWSEKSKVI